MLATQPVAPSPKRTSALVSGPHRRIGEARRSQGLRRLIGDPEGHQGGMHQGRGRFGDFLQDMIHIQ